MYRYKIKFIALNDTIAFEIKSQEYEVVENFVNDLLSIFLTITEDNEPLINSLQNYSPTIANGISEFIDKYKANLPQLNAVSAFFRKLNPNEKFYFLPNIELELAEGIKLRDYLRAMSEGKDFTEINNQTTELFGEILSKYNIGTAGDQRISIGENERNKRLCRFCQNKSNPTTFVNKSHAISEALGNKTVVLYDECDTCNKRFSETIEPDIIQYLALFRTIFKVKGKGGDKKFKGRNFNLSNNENVLLEFQSLDDRPEKSENEYNIKLKADQPIVLQNIYKSLCKYFLSVIDVKYLSHFEKTISWINGEIEIENFPYIAEMISYHSFSFQPKLTYYIRKSEDKNIPYAVGEFYFTCKVFVFIVPLSNQDDSDFISQQNFDNFWKTFKHFDKTKGWIFNNYSNNKPREFNLNLNFKINKDNNT